MTAAMIEPPAAWYAGFVARWHAGDSAPWLARSGDRVDGHGGRMAVLALRFWGRDAGFDLIAACNTHDLGEIYTGDVPFAAKSDDSLHALLAVSELAALECMGMDFYPEADDRRRLKFLDRLDAYLWAQHHAPQLMARPDWRKARTWLVAEAQALGVGL